MKRLALVIVMLGGLMGGALPVYAGHEFVPIQERAQGQSLVGSSQLNDSLYSNPAGSAFTQVYTVEGVYGLPKTFAASVLDTKSSAIGAGLGYFRRLDEGQSDPVQGAKLALVGKMTDYIGLGFSGKALWGPDAAGNKTSFKDVDGGLLVELTPVHLGFTMRNLFGGNAALNQLPEWGFGASFNIQNTLILNAATLGEMKGFKPYQYGFGMEYISQYFFSVKGGYRVQPDRHQSFWSGGISFLAPKVSFHYSVEVSADSSKKTEHLLGTMFLL